MAIAKMNRLRLIAPQSAADRLIADMARIGCVEITPSSSVLVEEGYAPLMSRGAGSPETARRHAEAVSALDALSRYCASKDSFLTPRRRVAESSLFDPKALESAGETAAAINACVKEIAALYSEEVRLHARRSALSPWVSLDVPLEYAGGKTFSFITGVCPASVDFDALSGGLYEQISECRLTLVSSDREQHYLTLLCLHVREDAALTYLKQSGFARTAFREVSGTAQDALEMTDLRLAEVCRSRDELILEIRGFRESRELLQNACDALAIEKNRGEAASDLLRTKNTVYLTGWVPDYAVSDIGDMLSKSGCAYEFSDPSDGDCPPVELLNSGTVSPFGSITSLYGTPAYGTVIDPNPFVAFFFFLFFGLMLSDAAYGLILAAGAFIVLKKKRPSGMFAKFLWVAVGVGISAFLWGTVFGSYFGDIIPAVAKFATGKTVAVPALINPIAEPMKVLVISLSLGFVHLFIGMGLAAWRMIRQGHFWDAVFDIGFWYVILTGLVTALLGFEGGIYAAAAGAAGVLFTAGRSKKNIFAKLASGLGSLYGVTGYLSDVLSYSRLMALGLSTGVVASVINTMGSLAGNGIIGWVFFLVVFIAGQTFNLAISLLGSFVHTCRLQYVEFFGKFFEGGGRPFSPLQNKTKYIEIIKEEH